MLAGTLAIAGLWGHDAAAQSSHFDEWSDEFADDFWPAGTGLPAFDYDDANGDLHAAYWTRVQTGAGQETVTHRLKYTYSDGTDTIESTVATLANSTSVSYFPTGVDIAVHNNLFLIAASYRTATTFTTKVVWEVSVVAYEWSGSSWDPETVFDDDWDVFTSNPYTWQPGLTLPVSIGLVNNSTPVVAFGFNVQECVEDEWNDDDTLREWIFVQIHKRVSGTWGLNEDYWKPNDQTPASFTEGCSIEDPFFAAGPGVADLDLVIDSNDEIRLAVTFRDGNVWYLEEQEITGSPPQSWADNDWKSMASSGGGRVSLAADSNDGVHLAWSKNIGGEVLYNFSSDGSYSEWGSTPTVLVSSFIGGLLGSLAVNGTTPWALVATEQVPEGDCDDYMYLPIYKDSGTWTSPSATFNIQPPSGPYGDDSGIRPNMAFPAQGGASLPFVLREVVEEPGNCDVFTLIMLGP